jgi:urea transport system ATP-binding protein
MSDLFIDSAQHGGQLGEGYGRAKTQGADFSHGIALYLEKVSVWFDSFRALNDLSLYIAEGELRCIIGPNGAGKTTLMDVITGKTRPTTGTAFFGQNYDLAKMSTEEIAEAGIGRKFQKPTVFENFTVMENLLLAAPRDKRVKKSLFSRLDPEAQLALDESLEQIRLKEFVKKQTKLDKKNIESIKTFQKDIKFLIYIRQFFNTFTHYYTSPFLYLINPLSP